MKKSKLKKQNSEPIYVIEYFVNGKFEAVSFYDKDFAQLALRVINCFRGATIIRFFEVIVI